MTSCPECSSANLETMSKEEGDREDDEHFVALTKFKCLKCGCEFEVTERFEVETNVTRHGMPEELSLGQFDNVVLESKAFEVGEEKEAEKYAEKHGGIVYTQVDAGDTVAYLRGFHLVNRNRYEVVLKAAEP